MELVINVRCYLQAPITEESKSMIGVKAAPPRSTYLILKNLPSPPIHPSSIFQLEGEHLKLGTLY
jgi:hypothetical protein